MSNYDYTWSANFIRKIAYEFLCDLYVRGKYRDVILPIAKQIESDTHMIYDGARARAV